MQRILFAARLYIRVSENRALRANGFQQVDGFQRAKNVSFEASAALTDNNLFRRGAAPFKGKTPAILKLYATSLFLAQPRYVFGAVAQLGAERFTVGGRRH